MNWWRTPSIGDEENGEQALNDLLVGREVVDVNYGGESLSLTLDDGNILRVDASLDCCAHGVVETENVIGGTIMSVTTEGTRGNNDTELTDDYGSGDKSDSTYKIFLMKNGLPDGTITVDSYESNGFYGSGYTLYVTRPEEDE